jgi:NADH-quinone oxidoreductase subunit A
MAESRFESIVETPHEQMVLTPQAEMLYREMGIKQPKVSKAIPATLVGQVDGNLSPQETAAEVIRAGGKQLAWVTIVDILIFFAVLLVGFAYVWRRGDLDWVRAITRENADRSPRLGLARPPKNEQSLSV